MKTINLQDQFIIKLNNHGLEKVYAYLISSRQNTEEEAKEITKSIKENNYLLQTELWRFIEIFGNCIDEPESTRGFKTTTGLIKNNAWEPLNINEVALAHLTENGIQELKKYEDGSILSQIDENHNHRIVLWELYNIYGTDILRKHPFVDNQIILETNDSHLKYNSFLKQRNELKELANFLKLVAKYNQKFQQGLKINDIYTSLLKENNIKYISRRGINHAMEEKSSNRFIAGYPGFRFEEELYALAYAYHKNNQKNERIPFAIRTRILEMQAKEE